MVLAVGPLRADGSMVPEGSMMPLPMPALDMVAMGCACTEYIPGGAGVAQLEGRCCSRPVVSFSGVPIGGARRGGDGDTRRVVGAAWASGGLSQRSWCRDGSVQGPKLQRWGQASQQQRTVRVDAR